MTTKTLEVDSITEDVKRYQPAAWYLVEETADRCRRIFHTTGELRHEYRPEDGNISRYKFEMVKGLDEVTGVERVLVGRYCVDVTIGKMFLDWSFIQREIVALMEKFLCRNKDKQA